MYRILRKEYIKNKNETSVELQLNMKRWYLPLGLDWRFNGGRVIQRRIAVGLLCFNLIFTRCYGLSPYSKSIHRFGGQTR